MTLDEAIMKASQALGFDYPVSEDARKFIDMAVALGILKLDEPKSASARLCEALGWTAGARSEHELVEALNAANLKLVEK